MIDYKIYSFLSLKCVYIFFGGTCILSYRVYLYFCRIKNCGSGMLMVLRPHDLSLGKKTSTKAPLFLCVCVCVCVCVKVLVKLAWGVIQASVVRGW